MVDQHAFWQAHARFLNTPLTSELPHPLTHDLSTQANENLPAALSTMRQVDLEALQRIPTQNIEQAQRCLQNHLRLNRRIFIIGCGASGRMAVWLGYQWRLAHPERSHQVVDMIAGGDFALIRSIEAFEDQASLAAAQLTEQQFSRDDVLIACSASGESPFLLAAVQHALDVSDHAPWLVFCNPEQELLSRNPQHLMSHPNVVSHSLLTGPMAITGSTRMQATTAMQVFLGLSLFGGNLDDVIASYPSKSDCQQLAHIITAEATAIENRSIPITYTTSTDLALCVLSDTTERTPTFNLPPFDNQKIEGSTQAWFQLNLPDSDWSSWLLRPPHCLSWEAFPQTFPRMLQGFSMSHPKQQPRLSIAMEGSTITFSGLGNQIAHITLSAKTPAWAMQTWLRTLLNMHSSLVMGRLGYFQGNQMTHLIPSNHKLIDRSIRYLQYRYQQVNGDELEYQLAAECIFAVMPELNSHESIVDKAMQQLQQLD